MNIILGEQQAQALSERYVILPLDTFCVEGHTQLIKSYCVIETLPAEDLPQVNAWRNLHLQLIENYYKKNWTFCLQCIEHLIGHWNKEIDSFYLDLASRMRSYQEKDPGPDWTGFINR